MCCLVLYVVFIYLLIHSLIHLFFSAATAPVPTSNSNNQQGNWASFDSGFDSGFGAFSGGASNPGSNFGAAPAPASNNGFGHSSSFGAAPNTSSFGSSGGFNNSPGFNDFGDFNAAPVCESTRSMKFSIFWIQMAFFFVAFCSLRSNAIPCSVDPFGSCEYSVVAIKSQFLKMLIGFFSHFRLSLFLLLLFLIISLLLPQHPKRKHCGMMLPAWSLWMGCPWLTSNTTLTPLPPSLASSKRAQPVTSTAPLHPNLEQELVSLGWALVDLQCPVV
jgi:hypothetical protein